MLHDSFRNVKGFLKDCHQGIHYPLKLTIIPCLKEFRITQCAKQKLQGSHNVRQQLHSKNAIEYEQFKHVRRSINNKHMDVNVLIVCIWYHNLKDVYGELLSSGYLIRPSEGRGTLVIMVDHMTQRLRLSLKHFVPYTSHLHSLHRR